MFHPRCGGCVHFCNGNKTAARDNPTQEFNRGLIFSLEPIKDNEMFEVKIDKKLNTWSGSIEIGVTVCNPDVIDIPITATDLRGGTWIMLGQGVLRDGRSLHEAYGCDLDKLVEGDRVGVMRTSQGDLKFYVNGECQGVAAGNLPQILYAVVDMYGKCAQVTLTAPSTPDSNTLDEDSISEVSSMRDSNILDSQVDHVTSSSLTNVNNISTSSVVASVAVVAAAAAAAATSSPITCSALNNHVANISIANSLMSNSDSNVLNDERDGRESSCDVSESLNNPTPISTSVAASPVVRVSLRVGSNNGTPPESQSIRNCNNIPVSNGTPSSGFTISGAVGGSGTNNTNNNNGTNNNGNGAANGNEMGSTNQNSNNNPSSNLDNMTNYSSAQDRLRFHDKCGTLVKLSNSSRTAERRRPLDEFNNGVVMSCRALRENELFEIRIDRLVDKWSGSIEVGITTHNPGLLDFPATMTNMRSGTTMMSGTGILTNGKGIHREYGQFNLDELKEGDRIGMMIKTGGELHYYINGLDQGIAATSVPSPVWSVVDLYGMTVKVTIVDRDEREEQNLITRRNTQMGEVHPLLSDADDEVNEELHFHHNCGTYAQVINNGRTCHRPNASEDFNNGVVLTKRPLKPNEMFEVRLDKCVDKWAGSLEIGVTTHPPTDLEYPSTMTNVRSGTWMMTGNGVMHNGTTIIDDYGLNLDRLKVGDRVGVLRKDNGALYFFVNGVEQGLAASNVPENVYGVVDLYGQAAQASILQHNEHYTSEVLPSSLSSSTIYSDLRFHHLHGKNARILNGGLTAQRPNAHGEFNDAIVISNRQLHEGEMFEVMIDKMVDRWSGSLEAGVTAIPPEELDFPSTMTDIDYDTWMLSGSSVMRDGATIMNNYRCDLDALVVGTRVGMMRHSDGSLHYYVNGEDQGTACENLPPEDEGLWPVVDLYGQCAQVTIVHNPIRHDQSLISVSQYLDMSHLSLPAAGQTSVGSEVLHRFSKCCGANIALSNYNTLATRIRHFNHGLIFTSHPLEAEELFEVRIEKVAVGYCGSLGIGFTSLPIGNSYPSVSVPASLSGIESADTWWVSGSDVRRNGTSILKLNFCPNLGRLLVGDRIGIKRTSDGAMRLYINGDDFGIAATNVTKRVFGVVDLFGFTESVSTTSVSRQASSPIMDSTIVATTANNNNAVSQDSLELSQPDSRHPPGHGSLTSGFHPSSSAHIPHLDLRQSFDLLGSSASNQNRQDSGRDSGQNGRHAQNAETRANVQSAIESSTEIRNQQLPPIHSKESPLIQFHEKTGKNIQLSSDRLSAKRSESYNQGIVMSSKPLVRNVVFQVRLGSLNSRWSSSLMIGVTAQSPEKLHLPNTAFALKRNTWVVCGDSVFYNGVKIKGRYGPDLDSLAGGTGGHVVGVMVDNESRLHLLVNGVDQGVAAKEIPPNPYVVLDLYGQCQEATVTNSLSSAEASSTPVAVSNTNATSHITSGSTTTTTAITTATPISNSITSSTNTVPSANTVVVSSTTQIGNDQNKKNLLKTQNHHHNHHHHHHHNIQQQQQQQQTPSQPPTQLPTQQPSSVVNHNQDNTSSNISNNDSIIQPNITTEHITQSHPPKDKEKGITRAMPDSSIVKNCEYQNMCHRFKASLALPEGYFNSEGNLCYCETCHKIRGDELYYSKGNPPKQYAQPFGWCRFGLVSGVGDNNESWHMAYHGSRPGAIRRMLDKGELLFSGELGVSSTLAGRRSKDDDSDGSQLCFSPTITYASADPFSPPVIYIDPCTRKSVQVQVVLQVAVKPGSYKVGSPSIAWTPNQHETNSHTEPHLQPDTIEWVTKERGATQLLALLIRMEEEK